MGGGKGCQNNKRRQGNNKKDKVTKIKIKIRPSGARRGACLRREVKVIRREVILDVNLGEWG